MKPFFTADDFKSLEISTHGAENCAAIANRVLQERGVLVYLDQGGEPVEHKYITASLSRDGCEFDATHQAILVCVEEMEG